MKRNVSVVCVYSRCNILISGKIIKEMPGSVASGALCIFIYVLNTSGWQILKKINKNNTKLLLKIRYLSRWLFRATLRSLAGASEEPIKLKLC